MQLLPFFFILVLYFPFRWYKAQLNKSSSQADQALAMDMLQHGSANELHVDPYSGPSPYMAVHHTIHSKETCQAVLGDNTKHVSDSPRQYHIRELDIDTNYYVHQQSSPQLETLHETIPLYGMGHYRQVPLTVEPSGHGPSFNPDSTCAFL